MPPDQQQSDEQDLQQQSENGSFHPAEPGRDTGSDLSGQGPSAADGSDSANPAATTPQSPPAADEGGQPSEPAEPGEGESLSGDNPAGDPQEAGEGNDQANPPNAG